MNTFTVSKVSLLNSTPILFISEYTNLEDRLKAYSAGSDDYFTKPINKEELSVKIEKLLNLKRN